LGFGGGGGYYLTLGPELGGGEMAVGRKNIKGGQKRSPRIC